MKPGRSTARLLLARGLGGWATWLPALTARLLICPAHLAVPIEEPEITTVAPPRPILWIGFLALPVRGLICAVLANPILLVPRQLRGGTGIAVFGIMVPLIAADTGCRYSGSLSGIASDAGNPSGIGRSRDAIVPVACPIHPACLLTLKS